MPIAYIFSASFAYPFGREWTILIHTGDGNNGVKSHYIQCWFQLRQIICPTIRTGNDHAPNCKNWHRFPEHDIMPTANKHIASEGTWKNVLCSGYVHQMKFPSASNPPSNHGR